MKFFLLKGVEGVFVFGGESDAICTSNLTYFVPMPELNIEIIGLDFIFDWRGFYQAAWQESCCVSSSCLGIVPRGRSCFSSDHVLPRGLPCSWWFTCEALQPRADSLVQGVTPVPASWMVLLPV